MEELITNQSKRKWIQLKLSKDAEKQRNSVEKK